ncbi:hypothetical protein [Myroides odoratimimus]|uniref:hypothetical protein n=1 Tax=Myroides odoratimimus TaxID=76832 RepID=UPI002574E878|nr:hypothetical protein [Myroides odoratimimus]MDM1057898.1 hypothetical protein [Myroides odoratimimus]
MKKIDTKLNTRIKNTTQDAIVIEFTKHIMHYEVPDIIEFISKYVSKIENYHIITAVECTVSTYCRIKDYPLYSFDIEKVIEEAKNDPIYSITRLYFFEDNPNRLICRDIVTEFKHCN